MVERYRSKLRGPLADRIDMMIDVTRPDPRDYRGCGGYVVGRVA